jgi:hypothetical protein
MIVACSGTARPIRNSVLAPRRNRPRPPRMIAKAAMNATNTAGITAPSVTITLLKK